MANPWESAVILRDKQGAPIPQLWDSSQNKFIPYEGKNKLYGPDGNLISTENPLPVQLSGSIIADTQAVPSRQQNKVEIITLLNAVSVPVYNAEDFVGTTVTTNLDCKGANEVYVAVNIDKQPWSAGVSTWTGYIEEGLRLFPSLKDITETFTNPHVYKLALIYSGINTIETIDSYEKALRAAYYPPGISTIRIYNKSSEVATCTVKLIKVWR